MVAKVIKSGNCCRYSWKMVEGTDILHFFLNNENLFNKSWNVFAFNKNKELIPRGATIENSWVMNDMILFSGTVNKFCDWDNRVKWDEVGTWFISLYPTEIPSKEIRPVALHKRDMPLLTCEGFESYFMLPEEWEFIHKVNPDFVLVKQSKKKMFVAALDEMYLNLSVENLPSLIDGDPPF